MGNFITALTNNESGLSSQTFWGELTPMVPLLVILVPLAFGIYVIRRSIKGASKGKARI